MLRSPPAPVMRTLRVERQQRAREIRGSDRDAVAGLEAVLAVVADLRVAGVAARQPAGQVGMAEVPAAHVLRQVARDGALIAQLRRGRRAARPATARRSARPRGRRPRRPRRASQRRSRARRRGARSRRRAARARRRASRRPCRATAAAPDRCRPRAAARRRVEQRQRLVDRGRAEVGAHPARASRKRRRVIGEVRTRTPVAW